MSERKDLLWEINSRDKFISLLQKNSAWDRLLSLSNSNLKNIQKNPILTPRRLFCREVKETQGCKKIMNFLKNMRFLEKLERVATRQSTSVRKKNQASSLLSKLPDSGMKRWLLIQKNNFNSTSLYQTVALSSSKN